MPVRVGSAYGEININLSGIDRAVTQATGVLSRLESGMKRMGDRMRAAGDSMTAGLTLPLAAVGVAAGKASMDFEASMQQIVGLVGVAQSQVDAWTTEVKALGPELGRGPNELAKALYFVTSAGIQGAEAIEVVTAAGQAASAGLGETQVIADAVSSALNAYGKENISAAYATSVLVAAVREGKAEAAAIAPVLGRVIPIAAELGISFDQVGAAIAAQTRVGFDAAEAATNLSGIMSAMLKPTKQASEVMGQFGLSAEGLRETIREQGLLAALALMRDTIGEDEEAMARIFPNIRGFRGLLSLVGENAEAAEVIFSKLAQTTEKDLTNAFQAATQTAKFQFNQAMADVQVALIGLGDVILPVLIPILQQLVGTIKSVADWFGNLSPQVQDAIVKALLFVAALGPILSIGGRVVGAVASMIGIIRDLGGMMITVAGGALKFGRLMIDVATYIAQGATVTLGLAAALVGLAAGLVVIVAWLQKVGEASKASNEELVKMSHSGDVLAQSAAAFEILANGSKRVRDAFVEHQADMKGQLIAGKITLEDYNTEIERSARVAGLWGETFQVGVGMVERVDAAVVLFTQHQVEQARASEAAIQDWKDQEKAAYDVADAHDDVAGSSEDMADGMTAAEQAARDLAAAQKAEMEAAAAVNAQFEALKFLMEGPVGDAQKEYAEKETDLITKQKELEVELLKLQKGHGAVVEVRKKDAMGAEELAYKQALLADKSRKLAEQEDQNGLAALKLKSEMAGLEEQIGKNTGAVTTYVNNSKRIGEVKGELEEVNTALSINADAHDDHLRRVLFDIAAEQLAIGGLTTLEYTALQGLAAQWGLVDSATATAVANVMTATQQLAEDKSLPAFYGTMGVAFNEAKGIVDTTEETLREQRDRMKGHWDGAKKDVEEFGGGLRDQIMMAEQEYIPALTTAVDNASTQVVRVNSTTRTQVADMNAGIVESAKGMLTDVQTEMRTRAPGITTPLLTAFQNLSGGIGGVISGILGAINGLLTSIAGIDITIPAPHVGPTTNTGGTEETNPTGPAPFQQGGRFGRGILAQINEAVATRPELIVPDFAGYVLTRQDAMAALEHYVEGAVAGVGVNQPIVNTVTYNVEVRDRWTGAAMIEQMRRDQLGEIHRRFGG